MKALLIAAAACAALSSVPAMAASSYYRPSAAATDHYRPTMAASGQYRPFERVQIIPLSPALAQADLGNGSSGDMSESYWARDQVLHDPVLFSALRSRGISLDRVIDLGRYSNGLVDIYVSA